MKYRVIQCTELDDLIKQINDRIAVGWKPQGGVSVVVWNETNTGSTDQGPFFLYFQAMIYDK